MAGASPPPHKTGKKVIIKMKYDVTQLLYNTIPRIQSVSMRFACNRPD